VIILEENLLKNVEENFSILEAYYISAAGVPLKQLWYHDAVLFLSPAALNLKAVSIPNY
jgi:hypothetical protein